MSTDIELHDDTPSTELVNRRDLRNRATDSWTDVLVEVGELAVRIADTDFVPATFKGSVPAVAATILAGREVGFAPMTSLASMHSIKGKVGLYAEAMRALVFQAGHEIVIEESSSSQCTVKGRRSGSDQWTKVTWTMADARQAGLLNSNKNWTTYPRQMLSARASTELCRLVFPDVIRGLASVEELEQLDEPIGVVGSGPEGGSTPVKRASRKRTKAEPAETEAPPLPEDKAETQTGAESGGAPGKEPSPRADSAPPLPEDAPSSPDDVADSGAVATTSGGSDSDTPSLESEPSPDEDGAVPAEIVEDEHEAEPRMTPDQRPAMMAGFTKLQVKDKAERLQITTDLIGRPVESANDLTVREASSVIDTLAMCKTRDDLENVIQATVAHRDGGES